jgi:tripartite-type tricarboxylate transporter receptor subunit TctC
MNMRKLKWLYGVIALLTVCFLGTAQAADFPVKDLSGVIQWGAGGATDNVARAVTPYVEKVLGKQIILQNKPGAAGAVGLQWVHNQPADGYTLLYGAENPTLYRVLDISQLEYKDFYPISIIARNVAVVICNVNQPWKNINDLFADAKKNPGQIKMGSTGAGGLTNVAAAMFRSINGVTFNPIGFPGEGPVITSMLGGHVQWSTVGLASAREHIRAGRVRALALLSDTKISGLEDVPLITTASADYKKYLPWGPFYGVFVKKETPDAVKKVLVDAYAKGLNDPKAQEFIKNFGSIFMGISGAEAETFLNKFQSVTTWLLDDAKEVKVSPANFGIPKP